MWHEKAFRTDAQTLTTCLFVAAVVCLVHQHFTFPITNNRLGNGTYDGLTLNTHSVFITNTCLAAALPGVTNLFKRSWCRDAAALKLDILSNWDVTSLGFPSGPVQPLILKKTSKHRVNDRISDKLLASLTPKQRFSYRRRHRDLSLKWTRSFPLDRNIPLQTYCSHLLGILQTSCCTWMKQLWQQHKS